MMTKACSVCRETKLLEDFYRNRSHRTGRKSQCKECERKRNMEPTRHEQIRAADRRYKKKKRETSCAQPWQLYSHSHLEPLPQEQSRCEPATQTSSENLRPSVESFSDAVGDG